MRGSVKYLILLHMFVCPATLSVSGSRRRRWIAGCLYVKMKSLKVIAVDFNRVAEWIQNEGTRQCLPPQTQLPC